MILLYILGIIRSLFALDLIIGPEDLLIEPDRRGGYWLWIRKKPQIGSILLTETTKDPAMKLHNYALRNPQYNPANGNEKRMLDGKFLETKKGFYSLIDSTPEEHPRLKKAFKIFIPFVVEYGSQWSRHGKLQVVDGTFINIRAFSKAYGDYSGGFKDNPYKMKIEQIPIPDPPRKDYIPEAVKTFKKAAKESRGKFIYSKGTENLMDNIRSIIEEEKGTTLDLVLALDTTESMKEELPLLKDELIPLLESYRKKFKQIRAGMVVYKDYNEVYITKRFNFETDLSKIQKKLMGLSVYGGKDIPEAVHEALYEALRSYFWEAESRVIILIGDAPPHPIPRGKITEAMVYSKARDMDVNINAIILPQ